MMKLCRHQKEISTQPVSHCFQSLNVIIYLKNSNQYQTFVDKNCMDVMSFI